MIGMLAEAINAIFETRGFLLAAVVVGIIVVAVVVVVPMFQVIRVVVLVEIIFVLIGHCGCCYLEGGGGTGLIHLLNVSLAREVALVQCASAPLETGQKGYVVLIIIVEVYHIIIVIVIGFISIAVPLLILILIGQQTDHVRVYGGVYWNRARAVFVYF